MTSADLPHSGTAFPTGGGELGALMQRKDWSQSPLGPIEAWPAHLKGAVSLMLPAQVQIVMFWGPEFVALYNDAYAPSIGNKHPHALGRPAQEYWAELWDDLEPLLQRARGGETIFAEDRPFKIERHGYMEEVFFNISYSPVRDDKGDVAGVFCIVAETTERVLATRKLRDSEERFRSFAQAIPNHVWTSPPDGKLDWFNVRVYEYAGAEPGELDGHEWGKIVHPEDLPPAVVAWTHSLASGEIYTAEFRLRSSKGDYRWHLSRAVPIRDETGAVSRWVGTNTDIHDQKEIAAELATLNETLELRVEERTKERDRIWNHSSELMTVAGIDGYIRAANASWTHILGWEERELYAVPFSEFIHPEDLERTAEIVGALSRGEQVMSFENRMRTKDGSYRTIDWAAIPTGEIFYAIGRDITDQRAAEEALRQSQKMEAVGQLTGGIAHDFNNLLQGILGSLDLAQKRIAQNRTGEIARFLSGAQASANRAASLTHRLLAFSRRQPLDPKTVRANKLVSSMEELLRRTLGEKIELEFVLAAGLWPTLCDPNQLESALLNLAINARDAMPDGGKITIETCNAHLDGAYVAKQREILPGHYICIAVTDTGSGMGKDVLERAFDPFFTTKPTGQGTGLGLSMVYGFARQSEGYAKIYSEAGEGTTVKIYLPRYRGEEEAEEAAAVSAVMPGADGENVLVVEDDTIVRQLIVEVLRELGYRVREAGDGPSGLRILESDERIDLLITDIGLPGLNGRQIADAARVRRAGLKVLFMTGYAENAALANGFLEPGMEMVTKPFTVDALAERIRTIFER
jgi:PAS domain S-box-containing protein